MVDKDRQKIRYLLIVKDRKGKRIIPLSFNTYSLGRSQDSSIVLYSSSVSRHHATIIPIADFPNKLAPFKIIDGNLQGIKSTNGLFVNGVKCVQHNLKHGDFIEFGDKVKVTYYTLFNLSEAEFNQFCELQGNSNINEPIVKSQIPTINSSELTASKTTTLTNLAAFPQSIPYPLIEIDLSGSITYYNPAAIKQFPELLKLKQNHPVIKELPKLVQKQDSQNLVREIKLKNQFFEQSIHYLFKEKIVRVLMLEITAYRQAKTIQAYSDRLIQEVVAVSGVKFATKIQSLLKIGCDCFELDFGFLAKLQKQNLTIAAVSCEKDLNLILEKEQTLEADSASSQKSARLFQATIEANQPITLQQFELQENLDDQASNQLLKNEPIPITAYLGIPLIVGKKIYGILAFGSSVETIKSFDGAQIDFLSVMAKCLVREIERQKIELILTSVLQQKNYYQQIAEDIVNPIDRVKAIAQQLINTIDSQQDLLPEIAPEDNDNWLSLIEHLGIDRSLED